MKTSYKVWGPNWGKTSLFGGGGKQKFFQNTQYSHLRLLTAPNFRKNFRVDSANKMHMLLGPKWGKNSPICGQSELLQDFDKSCHHDAITYMSLQYTIILQNLRKVIRDFKNNIDMILDPNFSTSAPFWVQQQLFLNR